MPSTSSPQIPVADRLDAGEVLLVSFDCPRKRWLEKECAHRRSRKHDESSTGQFGFSLVFHDFPLVRRDLLANENLGSAPLLRHRSCRRRAILAAGGWVSRRGHSPPRGLSLTDCSCCRYTSSRGPGGSRGRSCHLSTQGRCGRCAVPRRRAYTCRKSGRCSCLAP